MEDEKQNEKKQEDPETKPLSIVDEARAIRNEIIKERERLEEERKTLQTAQSEKLLSGTSGGHVEAEPVKEETAKEYSDRIMKNEVKPE